MGQLEDEINDLSLARPGSGLAAQGGCDRHQLLAVLAL
jgi:hypothetical protein